MRRATLDVAQARELAGSLAGNVEEAKRVLGKALLAEGGSALFSKAENVDDARKALTARQEALGDAEAMLAALEDFERQQKAKEYQRQLARECAIPPAPSVTMDQVKAEQKRFEWDYANANLKYSPALLERGRELLALAKECGQVAVNDSKRFLGMFNSSPKLKSL
jgi:hypothetical protein